MSADVTGHWPPFSDTCTSLKTAIMRGHLPPGSTPGSECWGLWLGLG